DLTALSSHILERSREASLEAVRALPAGTYRNEMVVDGYDKPVTLVATMTIGADGIDVDFTGTSGVSAFGINVPFCYAEAYSSFGIKCIVSPKVPNNAGSLSVIRITAPDGCILNAQHPSPVATRHITGQLLPDLMFGCLAQSLHNGVPAEGTSCLWNLFAMGGDSRIEADLDLIAKSRAFNVMSFHSGGTGARPGLDGMSATAFPSGVKNCPIEITEALSPILVTKKEYRVDSGGAGEFRGGLGQVMEAYHLDDAPFLISANYDRVSFPPRGREDGMDGARGILSTSAGRTLRGKGQQTIQPGERFIMEMPGGGGLGHPFKRDPARVAADVTFGLVSREAALRDYGVVLRADGSVDAPATDKQRGTASTAATTSASAA
ncbi:MAG: hydantoinase B/oxoprolinase family protein, partial [Variovorax sp.]